MTLSLRPHHSQTKTLFNSYENSMYANRKVIDSGNQPQDASNDGTQPVTLPGIPHHSTDSIDRFLSRDDEIFPGHQRPPIEFRQIQDQAGAETEAKARAHAQLLAFDEKFASSGIQDS